MPKYVLHCINYVIFYNYVYKLPLSLMIWVLLILGRSRYFFHIAEHLRCTIFKEAQQISIRVACAVATFQDYNDYFIIIIQPP